jgi:hypothetical protein
MDREELFQRAAEQYREECTFLFDEYVRRLVRQTQLDEDEVLEWFGSLV